MAENVDDILDLHANESEEDSFENTLSESNDLNLLFGEDTQFPVSQVQTRARSNTRPESAIATNTTVTVCLFVRHLFSFIHFILISTVHALFLTCLPVSIYET